MAPQWAETSPDCSEDFAVIRSPNPLPEHLGRLITETTFDGLDRVNLDDRGPATHQSSLEKLRIASIGLADRVDLIAGQLGAHAAVLATVQRVHDEPLTRGFSFTSPRMPAPAGFIQRRDTFLSRLHWPDEGIGIWKAAPCASLLARPGGA